MLKPLNRYIQIEPQQTEGFIPSNGGLYNEIGTVIAIADGVSQLNIGDTVYFDAWLALKYPKKDGTFSWFVNFDNIIAHEQISAQPVSGTVSAQIQDTVTSSTGLT